MKGVANYILTTRDDDKYPISAEGVIRITNSLKDDGIFRVHDDIYPAYMVKSIKRMKWSHEAKLLMEMGHIDNALTDWAEISDEYVKFKDALDFTKCIKKD
jgi:hypothetical protein